MSEPPTPQQQLGQMVTGYWLSRALYVAAKLGVADLLRDGPRTADELPPRPAAPAGALSAAACPGERGRLRRGPMALRPDPRWPSACASDVPGSQRALAIMIGEEQYRLGRVALQRADRQDGLREDLRRADLRLPGQHPEQARLFDEAMVGVHGRETAAMLDAYDFSGIGDPGRRRRRQRQRPDRRAWPIPGDAGHPVRPAPVVERARPRIEAAGFADRCRSMAATSSIGPARRRRLPAAAHHPRLGRRQGRRSSERPPGDAEGAEVAGGGRRDPAGNEPSFGKLLDLDMLVIPGGKERTEEEYRRLFAAGFRLTRVIPTVGRHLRRRGCAGLKARRTRHEQGC